MNVTFDTVIFYPMSYSNVNVYLESNSKLVATGYFLGKSFSIQADYTQLKNYNYLLCDVSASTIIPTETNLPTKDINFAPISSYNYITDLYETQINQFYIINQPINYDLITSISYNIDLSALNYSVTLYSSTTVYSYSSDTIYSYSSLTVYNSFTLYSSTTVYSITSNTVYSYSSVTYYSSTTVYSYSSDTIYDSTTLYSSTTVYIDNCMIPIILSYTGNVTSWSTTYSLSYNQLMIISFTNSKTIFIPIQLTGNDNYRLILSQNVSAYNSGGTTNVVYLYPNNTSANVIYTEFYVEYNVGSVATGSDDVTMSAFRLTYALGSTDATIINNSPFTKTVIFRDVRLGLNVDPTAYLPAQIWNDYKTSWTMFGTIVLPQIASGYVKILRTA